MFEGKIRQATTSSDRCIDGSDGGVHNIGEMIANGLMIRVVGTIELVDVMGGVILKNRKTSGVHSRATKRFSSSNGNLSSLNVGVGDGFLRNGGKGRDLLSLSGRTNANELRNVVNLSLAGTVLEAKEAAGGLNDGPEVRVLTGRHHRQA